MFKFVLNIKFAREGSVWDPGKIRVREWVGPSKSFPQNGVQSGSGWVVPE